MSDDDQLFRIPGNAPKEVHEFLNREHHRASLVDDDRIMVDPSQVLANIENTMRRLDADINIEVSIDGDIATEKELMVMMGELRLAEPLIVFLINTGMQIMHAGDYPPELVTNPLPDHYDLTELTPLTVNPRQHQIAKTLFDRRSTSTVDLTEDDVATDLDGLDLAEKIEVFIILFYMWGTKIGAMKNVTGTE